LELVTEDLQTLIDLGLTLLQAKLYLVLVQIGTANVRTISQVSKVARPDVYRTLYKLQELGLIEKVVDKTAKFNAIPPDSALTILVHRRTMKCEELKSKIKYLRTKLKNRNNINSYRNESNFVIIPSQEALIKTLQKSIENTQKSICVATSYKRLKYACYRLSGVLEKAWTRGVMGRAIIEETGKKQMETIQACWRSPSAEIRCLRVVPKTVMAMYDKKEVFIFINPEADLKDSPALWSNDGSLVGIAEHYFEAMWNKARDVKHK